MKNNLMIASILTTIALFAAKFATDTIEIPNRFLTLFFDSTVVVAGSWAVLSLEINHKDSK